MGTMLYCSVIEPMMRVLYHTMQLTLWGNTSCDWIALVALKPDSYHLKKYENNKLVSGIDLHCTNLICVINENLKTDKN